MTLVPLTFSSFNIGEKVSRRSHYKDGFLPTLLDLDKSELATMLAEDFEEIPPEDLPLVPHNARIIYVRRDSGKTVLNSIVVKHFISKAGVALTMLAPPIGNRVVIGPRAAARGSVRVGQFGSYRYTICSEGLSQLFVCKSIALEDRITSLEAKFAILEAFADEAMKTIPALLADNRELTGRLEQAETHVEALEAFAEVTDTKNNEVQRHLAKQREVLHQTITAFSTLRNQISSKP